jgi:hypothetical protein
MCFPKKIIFLRIKAAWIGYCFLISAVPTASIKTASMEPIFATIIENHVWGQGESASGSGSSLEQTAVIRKRLPFLLKRLHAHTLLDAPCGDFHWMKEVDLKEFYYIGADVVSHIIEQNKLLYQTAQRVFVHADLAHDQLPHADLILCRDCLVHFSYQDIMKALRNFKRSGAKYLLTTTFPGWDNVNIATGGWRPLNLQAPPFSLPEPELLINERCTEANGRFESKSLGLWRIDTLALPNL